MGLAAGVLDRITSHDVRRGAFRDAAYLKGPVLGVETACPALMGGHSKKAEDAGLTREYVGSLQAPIYNLRAAEPFVDRLAPEFGASPMKFRLNTIADVDKYMDEHGMDKSNLAKRKVASCRL